MGKWKRKTKATGWVIVNRNGIIQPGIFAASQRDAKSSLTDLAAPDTQEANWAHWSSAGYQVVRCKIEAEWQSPYR